MFASSIRLGRILGIPIGLHYSWFIVFFLVTLSLVAQFTEVHPGWSALARYSLGLATSLLFFLSVLLHELGHSAVALRKGIPVRSITLFVFGGIAQVAGEPRRPADEFQVAIAGPLVSFLLAGLFGVLSAAMAPVSEAFRMVGTWLGSINFTLALFNLLPGFPLDGGRIFRAILWQVTGSYERGTRIASATGQWIAYFFIFSGVWIVFTGYNAVSGLWLGFIGWFLLSAAQATVAQLNIQRALAGIRAADVMAREGLILPSQASVAELVEEHWLRTGKRCALVADPERFVGLVTMHQIKKVPRERWPTTTLGAIAIPAKALHWVPPDMGLIDVLAQMDDYQVNQVPVISDGQLLGLLTREEMMHVIRTRLELGV